MHRPKFLKQAVVGDLRWVKYDLNHFGMSGLAGTDLFVGGLAGVTAHVTDRR